MADLGLIGGIADGFKQGLESYQKQKQQNFNNRALLAEMMSKGIQQDDSGNFQLSPGLLSQQKATELKSKHDIGQYDNDINNPVVAGAYAATNQSLKASNPDQKFNIPTGLSPADLNGENSIYGKDIAGGYAKQAGQIKAQAIGAGVAVRKDALNETVHSRALKDEQGDPQINALLTTKQNLENAKSNFQNGGGTTQEFNELQQAVRSNAGIKGSGGVGEREETYLKSLGINKDKFVQFITGDPQSVLKSDPAFAKQMMGLVDLEIQNKQSQAAQQIAKKAQGHKSFYQQPGNEGRAQDFNNVVSDQYSQFGLGPDGKPVQQQGSGLINQSQSQGGQDYPVGTKAKSKSGVPVIYKGGGVWAPQ